MKTKILFVFIFVALFAAMTAVPLRDVDGATRDPAPQVDPLPVVTLDPCEWNQRPGCADRGGDKEEKIITLNPCEWNPGREGCPTGNKP